MSSTADQGFDALTVVGHRPRAIAGAPPAAPPAEPRTSAPRPPGTLGVATPASDPRRARAEALAAATPQRPAGLPADRTRPTPGASGAMAAAPPRAEPGPVAESQPALAKVIDEPATAGDTLVVAATPLFALVTGLRDATEFADVEQLRREVSEQIRKFDEQAVKFGARASDVTAARYVLCSMVDEAVMTTPWGGASNWSTNSLLNRFHGETWGGEKVFQILERVKSEPQKYLALIKLIDMALVLGFEGTYRVIDQGREKLADLRDELGRLIETNSPPVPETLADDWQGVVQSRRLRNYFPLWIVFAAVGLLLVVFYGVQQYRLALALQPAEEQLLRLAAPSR